MSAYLSMRNLAGLALVLVLGGGCTTKTEPPTVDPNLQPAAIVDGKPLFRIRDLKIGTGKEAQIGSRLKVHYTAWLFDLNAENRRGKQFESTREADKLYEFTWGNGGLIRGWDQGLFGMQKGGIRELTIPAEMAFGAQGDGEKVPANTPVIYEIELVEVRDPLPVSTAPAKTRTFKPR